MNRTDRHSLQRCEHYLPGLRSTPWWDGTPFSFVPALEHNSDAIRREFMDILLSGSLRLHPQSKGGPRKRASDGDWNIFELWSAGKLNERNAIEAPLTTGLLGSFPELVTHRRGLVYFSVLQPHVHIRAHCGPTNTRIRTHLGLQVPIGARMRVGSQTRVWEEGKCLVFDDSWEHEVWNDSDQLRAVLLMDTWHPDLTPEQRADLLEIRQSADGKRQSEREGWRRPLPQDDQPENTAPSGLSEASESASGSVLGALKAEDAEAIRGLALTLRSCRQPFIVAAAEHALASLSREESAGLSREGRAPAENAVWPALSELTGAHPEYAYDPGNLVHLCSIYWRSNPHNLQAMYDYLDQWAAADRSALARRLIDLRTPLHMMQDLVKLQDLSGGPPFGALAPVLVTALRAVRGHSGSIAVAPNG